MKVARRITTVVTAVAVAVVWAAGPALGGGSRKFSSSERPAPRLAVPATPAPPRPPDGAPGATSVDALVGTGALPGPAAGAAAATDSGTSLGVTAMAKPAPKPPPPPPPPAATTLVLYDTAGEWGWLGGLYAQETANLASHFGSWTAKPVASYVKGDLAGFTATVYIGSTYDQPLPTAFLDDVLTATKPVVWIYDNVWQLSNRAGGQYAFGAAFGWYPTVFDFAAVSTVLYKGTRLTRNASNGAGILGMSVSTASVLATAERPDHTTLPWAVRSNNLTYVAEVPLAYVSETDRVLAFSDLLFDALDPTAVTRHRALVRLEDISPNSDPADLRQKADYLASQGIKFGFGVSPWYKDPTGVYNNGHPVSTKLRSARDVANAISYLESKGGTLIEHGYTHQWDGGINPYNEVTGDDYEFYRVLENLDGTLSFVGPLPGDSLTSNSGRMASGSDELKAAKVGTPVVWETPHYAGTVNTYKAAAAAFSVRWERSLYFAGFLSGTPDYTPARLGGQFFPYIVRDVYGSRVLPENVGGYEPEPWQEYPARLPADIIAAAADNLVVRDGFASFYFHPFWDLSALQQIVNGVRGLGYTFVDPATLLTSGT